MSTREVAKAWGHDPRWLRVEYYDDRAGPLNFVRFRRRTGCAPNESPSKSRMPQPMFLLVCAVVGLVGSIAVLLTTILANT